MWQSILFKKIESKKFLDSVVWGGTSAEKIRVQKILGLLFAGGGPVLKKLESKKFLDAVVWGGGTNAEKIWVQEILGLCCVKKLVILSGGSS